MAEQDPLLLKSLIVDLESKVSPAKLAAILGVNVSLLYQNSQQGRLPPDLTSSTYLECIQQYIRHYKKSQDLAIEKANNEAALKKQKYEDDLRIREEKRKFREEEAKLKLENRQGGYAGSDDGMPPLLAAKTKQDIRLSIAREAQLWVKAAIERGEYVNLAELVELTEPFIMSLRQGLLAIAAKSPELEKEVDLLMDNLYTLGTALIDQADIDDKAFLKEIMEKEVDVDSITLDLEAPKLL